MHSSNVAHKVCHLVRSKLWLSSSMQLLNTFVDITAMKFTLLMNCCSVAAADFKILQSLVF
jgi:hypothetical protein